MEQQPGMRSASVRHHLTGFAAAALLATAATVHAADIAPTAPVSSEAAASKTKPADSVLLDTLGAELKRAMASLGSDKAADQQPKPYFLSYAVADATGYHHGRAVRRDRQLEPEPPPHRPTSRSASASPAEDNTHGDHRNSALTTIPLPLTDDRAAIARSLWFATNRGYARALDGFLKVKTEQQVRAKEEDASADFSAPRSPQTAAPARRARR